jgi:hypothetical protein
MIFTIASFDLCRLYSFLKLREKKIDKNTENKTTNNERKELKRKILNQLKKLKKRR